MPDPVNIPKLQTPFKIVGSSALVVEQDSGTEVAQCVEAILKTPVGSRIEEPTLGVPDQTFSPSGKDTDEIEEAIDDWEPRAAYSLDDEEITEMVWRIDATIQREEERTNV